jgi:plastocyanin
VLFFWFGFSIHTFFSYLQGRGMAARSMSSSSRRLGAGLVMVMVVLMLALVQLHSVAGAEAAAAAGKTYTVAWNYPFQQNFYTHWNQGTSYVVGDRLRFLYNNKFHNVVRVNEEEFLACKASAVPHTDGDTVFHLNHPGRQFYICTHFGHCAAGMKLEVLVNVA